jgi:polyhydroxyalkanoate synthase
MPTDQTPRKGPRPLPTHLLTAALTYVSSNAALPFSKKGSLDWQISAEKTDGLADALTAADPNLLATAVEREGRLRLSRFLDGIEAYRHHPYRRNTAEPPVAAEMGSTRLLHFPATTSDAITSVLVVPSLVNRSYVLDLSEETSFMRWLATRGIEGYLVDWGRPGDLERGFNLTNYVTERLDVLFEVVRGASNIPVFVLGYCMGGNLALALALHRQTEVAGLAVLATPWDFHAEDEGSAHRLAATAQAIEGQLTAIGELSTDILQMLFCMLDPLLGYRKFQSFACMDPSSARANDFVALEDWLNDGVPLVAAVAQECLGGWYGENEPARGGWRIDGNVVDPAGFRKPSIAMIPARDRIVPPASAQALASALPNCETHAPQTGHIGMMASHNAEKYVWHPLETWIRKTVGNLNK